MIFVLLSASAVSTTSTSFPFASATKNIEKEFDANLHNAVMHVEDDEFGENIVAEELQKGYMYKENVLRHSMVKVAN